MERKYWWVFLWLVIFTVAELAVALTSVPKIVLAVLLLATAAGKALLIALYFMHLKYEKGLVWLLPGIPLFFAIFLICGLFPDIVWHLTWRP